MVVKSGDNVITGKHEVLEVWKSEFEKLYNDDSMSNFDDEHLKYVQQNVPDMSNVPGPDVLNKMIDLAEVKAAVYRNKLRKAPGVDEIPIEVLRNENCIKLLYTICNQCFITGTVPTEWKKGIINPIPKSSDKDNRIPTNYRGITLISIPCKIYCDILNFRLTGWLEEQNIVVDEQNGYRKKRSVLDHLYSLYNVLNNRKNARLSTFACYIDLRKAFDNVNRDCLWFKLMNHGIEGRIYNAIRSLYDNVKCSIRINGYLTPWFNVNNGVKQGCKISPVLFQIYINDLAVDIKRLLVVYKLQIEI